MPRKPISSSSASDGFESPSTPESSEPGDQPNRENTEYDPPGDDTTMSLESVNAEVESFLAGIDRQIMSVKEELERLIDRGGDASMSVQSAEAMESNIVGVGIGLGDGTSAHAVGVPGEPVLEVYTIEPEGVAQTKARLASVAGISALASADFPMHVVHTGIIDAFPHRMRLRPAPCGISVGHKAITAGTIGCLSRGRSAPRNARLMVLSNNHVLANVNAGILGDAILQPGPFDGGKVPADQIAVLERFVAINFAAGANNTVDCATGWCWPDRVRKEHMYLNGGVVNYFNIGTTPVAAVPGLQVGKSGRTTQLTRGGVTAVGVTINVNYGGGRVARFVNQFAVRSPSGDFSQGGDSGSLIWTWDSRRAPVGLLFAGGGGTTFANLIGPVLSALDIIIVA